MTEEELKAKQIVRTIMEYLYAKAGAYEAKLVECGKSGDAGAVRAYADSKLAMGAAADVLGRMDLEPVIKLLSRPLPAPPPAEAAAPGEKGGRANV